MDVINLKHVYLTPVSVRYWEIIVSQYLITIKLFFDVSIMQEMSGKTISNCVLEQTRIVSCNQILLIWINKSIHVTLSVGEQIICISIFRNSVNNI